MKAVLIPGDGIGREIAESVGEVSAALNTGIEWQEFAAGAEYAAESGELIAPGTLDAIEACGWALKGPTATPCGTWDACQAPEPYAEGKADELLPVPVGLQELKGDHHSVAVQVDSDSQTLLRRCATTAEDHYFPVNSASGIGAAFDRIRARPPGVHG